MHCIDYVPKILKMLYKNALYYSFIIYCCDKNIYQKRSLKIRSIN